MNKRTRMFEWKFCPGIREIPFKYQAPQKCGDGRHIIWHRNINLGFSRPQARPGTESGFAQKQTSLVLGKTGLVRFGAKPDF